jgi:outer membrane protein assembly factor BamB/tetratricopeptide (TPR) repeat protein
MSYRLLIAFLFVCCPFVTGIAQETGTEQGNPLYESVVVPDRSLSRRLDQANRLFEAGRMNEAAQLLGGILESAEFPFILPETSTERTLHLTVNDSIINQIRKLPKEARESYSVQFEPIAKRLLENATQAGSLDDIQQVARKYFPSASGATAAFLVGLTQFERGDYAAAFLTLDKLKRLHASIPDSIAPALEQMLEKLSELKKVAEQPPTISESAWLEQIGWRLPMGTPSQNPNTAATAPLLEQSWAIPLYTRLQSAREADTVTRQIKAGDVTYIPAAQPILVGNLFATRTPKETVVIDANTGKRLWFAPESEYRFPAGMNAQSLTNNDSLRLFLWHNRIAQQLSSDGEKLFSVDGHTVQIDPMLAAVFGGFGGFGGRAMPNLFGRGDDLRYGPGSTLTARDLKTGQILWQAGKFPYVQKYIDALLAPRPRTPNTQANQPPRVGPAAQVDIDERIFTDDEKALKETWFLGAPLPIYGRLYVIGEIDGVLQLIVLESQTGRLIAKQPFALSAFPITSNVVRRTYPLLPSVSEGIVICPSGNGIITALDASTLSPIWCYTYAPAKANTPANRAVLRQMQMFPNFDNAQLMNAENSIRNLLNESGWQVPGVLVDRGRVLIAPPDRAALYCLNLLSGELIWEQSISRHNALYVACIQNDKVFVVTPGNLMVFNIHTGKDITPSGERFPAAFKPAGVGVHSGNQYFIPFSDGHLAVADLTEGKLTWLDATGAAILPPDRDAAPRPNNSVNAARQMVGLRRDFNNPDEEGLEIFSPDLKADDLFQKPIQFGNLVGIKGRFFSQSPTQVLCFDQKETLRRRAEVLLQADTNDPDGLIKQGRVLKADGKLTEAIDSFRASLKAKPTDEAADWLRKNLLEALRNDYDTWSNAYKELETLVDFPDELGTILYAQIEGILQSGRTDDLLSVVEKVFAFGQEQSVLVPVSNDHSAQLHRVLGGVIDQGITKGHDPALKASWEKLAETFLQRLTENPAGIGGQSSITGLPMQWSRNTVYLPPDIQRWTMFTHIFQNTAAAEKAKRILLEKYEQYRLPVALDLQEKTLAVVEWSKLTSPYVWKTGTVELQIMGETSTPPEEEPKDEVDKIVSRLVNIARNPVSARTGATQMTVPFFGVADSETSASSYVVKSWASELFLCCNDSSEQEQWRVTLPILIAGSTELQPNRVVGEYPFYIMGFGNFLLFVSGNTMVAVNASPQSAEVLWTKTLSSPLMIRQNNIERRVSPGAQRPSADAPFPMNSVFVSPHVVCCWESETNCVYGLDPLTGQTLWVRKISQGSCTVLGDTENLFLVFPDVRQAVAVEPASGRELVSAPIEPGGIHTFGTSIVFMKRQGGNNEYAFYVCDLRDMHDKRRRAVMLPNLAEGQLVSSVPAEMIQDKINSSMTLIQTMQNDRFISVANWSTKSLQIHDLQTKKKLLPDENKMLEFIGDRNVNRNSARCDVEFVEDHFLVLFSLETTFQETRENVPVNGTTIVREFKPINVSNAIGVSVGKGVMMLFDSTGKPCWSEPTEVKNLCRLLDVPDRSPVMLFAVAYTDRDSTNKPAEYMGFLGIDKRSGKQRFRQGVNTSVTPMRTFRVSADPLTQAIIFTGQTGSVLPSVVKAIFRD